MSQALRSAPPEGTTALVLAGRRRTPDALARERGVTHKALIPVAGVPMLVRVLRTLRATPGVGRCVVSIDDPSVLDPVAELAAAREAGWLSVHRSRPSPSESVVDFLAAHDPAHPLLVTTADHALLDPAALACFLEGAARSDADVLVGVVTEEVVRSAFPEARRTFIPLRGERITGANLFVLRGPGARRAVRFWRRTEAHRKHPLRLAWLFGPATLALFALRRLDLEAAMARAGRRLGVPVTALRLPFARSAVDVDHAADLELAARVLETAGGG
jgi:GTP:adenosylcobinamide-phosphate guanylyltransferase